MKLIEGHGNCFAGSQNPIAKIKYTKISLKIEQISKLFNLLLIKLNTVGTILPCLIITAVKYFVFDSGKDSFYSPVPVIWYGLSQSQFDNSNSAFVLVYVNNDHWHWQRKLIFRTPFSWKTPVGYLVLLLAIFSSVLSMAFCTHPIACFAIGSYLLVTSFVKDIKNNDFRILTDKISNKNHLGMSAQLCSFMKDFSEIKQLSQLK